MKTVLAISFLTILLVTVSGCKKNYEDLLVIDKATEQVGVPVVVKPIEVVSAAIPVYAVGRVGTSEEVRLSFKIGGIIASANTKEGDYVRKGDVLATLRRNEIDAQVMKAQRAYDKSIRDLERINKMYGDGAATLENVQDLTTLVDVTKSDLDIAIFNQSYATIVSPISGRVIQKKAESNELVSPGQQVYVIADDKGSSYVLKTGISDRDLNRIKLNDRADVFLDAFGEELMVGKVSDISESANPTTGTFDIEISMSLAGKRIRNGYIGRATIVPNIKQDYIKIPFSAIVEVTDDMLTAYTIGSDSIAQKLTMSVAYVAKDEVWIKAKDFPDVENIVITGGNYLSEGAKVAHDSNL